MSVTEWCGGNRKDISLCWRLLGEGSTFVVTTMLAAAAATVLPGAAFVAAEFVAVTFVPMQAVLGCASTCAAVGLLTKMQEKCTVDKLTIKVRACVRVPTGNGDASTNARDPTVSVSVYHTHLHCDFCGCD